MQQDSYSWACIFQHSSPNNYTLFIIHFTRINHYLKKDTTCYMIFVVFFYIIFFHHFCNSTLPYFCYVLFFYYQSLHSSFFFTVLTLASCYNLFPLLFHSSLFQSTECYNIQIVSVLAN